MNPTLWQGRRVLLTGHTGFKGSWLCKWLDMMGAHVLGISLPPDGFSAYSDLTFSPRFQSITADLALEDSLTETIERFQPEMVFHLAAQALVGYAFEHPLETFQSNVMGTARLLDALRHCDSLQAIVVVTSDKVYENTELGLPFSEGDRLGGEEPYSASKACEEWVTLAYARSYFSPRGVAVATARGSNVYGGGDYHYDRLIPALIDSHLRGEPLLLRNPNAIRPWQYVLCLLEGYLRLAEELLVHPENAELQGWNFGPSPKECVTVGSIAELLSGTALPGAPVAFAEAATLCLDARKSSSQLSWNVRVSLEDGLARTLDIYRRQRNGEAINNLMEEELTRYVQEYTDDLHP